MKRFVCAKHIECGDECELVVPDGVTPEYCPYDGWEVEWKEVKE